MNVQDISEQDDKLESKIKNPKLKPKSKVNEYCNEHKMSRPLEKDAVRSPFGWLQRLHKLRLSGLKAERVFSTISPQGTWNPETCVTNLLTGLNKRNTEDKSSDSRDWEKVFKVIF